MSSCPRCHSRRRSGFTLMEVLLVLAILVILGSFATVMISTAQDRANLDAAKGQVLAFKSALGTYSVTMKEYPSTQAGLSALLGVPADAKFPERFRTPFLEESSLPRDPWGNDYQYVAPGTNNPYTYDVWSMGPDGQSGTDDDIGNWDS